MKNPDMQVLALGAAGMGFAVLVELTGAWVFSVGLTACVLGMPCL